MVAMMADVVSRSVLTCSGISAVREGMKRTKSGKDLCETMVKKRALWGVGLCAKSCH